MEIIDFKVSRGTRERIERIKELKRFYGQTEEFKDQDILEAAISCYWLAKERQAMK